MAGVIGADEIGIASAATLISVKISSKDKPARARLVEKALHSVLKQHRETCKEATVRKFRGSVIYMYASSPNASAARRLELITIQDNMVTALAARLSRGR